MSKTSYARISGPHGMLARREPFEGNSMSAQTVTGSTFVSPGLLNSPDREVLTEAMMAGEVCYVVYSYLTPIAWVYMDGSVFITQQKFSVTTSRQQTYVRAWLAGVRCTPASTPRDILQRIDDAIEDWHGSADSMHWTPEVANA